MAQLPPALNSDTGHWETPGSWDFGPFYVKVRHLNGFSFVSLSDDWFEAAG